MATRFPTVISRGPIQEDPAGLTRADIDRLPRAAAVHTTNELTSAEEDVDASADARDMVGKERDRGDAIKVGEKSHAAGRTRVLQLWSSHI